MSTELKATTEYIMDSASAQGRQQLHNLEVLFDRATTNFIEDLGVWPGARCLDVGSGGGSIARWLAGRVGLGGEVVAVDIDTEQLDVPSRIEVHRHDISDGLPTNGTFDFIHARFVLMHLAERERVLRTLVDALAPGGWLVLGETPDSGPRTLAAPTAGDAEFADRTCVWRSRSCDRTPTSTGPGRTPSRAVWRKPGCSGSAASSIDR